MRARAVLLVVLLISTAGAALPMGSSAATDPHAAIVITSDGDFVSCACVRSGTGTALNPYIISDWAIDNPNGAAIRVDDAGGFITKHFVIRDNSLDASVGVVLKNTGAKGHIIANTITHRSRGVDAGFASPDIASNTFLAKNGFQPTAVKLTASNARVIDNIIQGQGTGVDARKSSPLIQDNRLVGLTYAMVIAETTSADIRSNIIHLSSQWGVKVTGSSQATLSSNLIDDGHGGILVDDSILTLTSNTVTNQKAEAVRFTRSDVFMVANTVSNNFAGAVGAQRSFVQILDNSFDNSQDTALRLDDVQGLVQNNVIRLNGIGISLGRSIITLQDNVLESNTWGLSIPYDSRQSIPLMSGNFVNGINVDGTVFPAHKSLFYKAKAKTIANRFFDHGVSGGHSGNVVRQGALVIYDSTDMLVENNTFYRGDIGVHIRGGERNTVRANLFIDLHIGVDAEASFTFIKNNTCEIEIDPPETICIRVTGGFSFVLNNTSIWYNIGIQWNGAVGIMENNTVVRARIGIQATGSFGHNEHDVTIHRNRLQVNVEGLVLIQFKGLVKANVIGNNSWSGVTLKTRTNATLVANMIMHNRVGIDEKPCSPATCSGGIFIENRVSFNSGTGIRVRGGGSFRANVVTHNTIGIAVDASSKFNLDIASHNRLVGIRVNGTAGMIDVIAEFNGEHDGMGIIIRGDCRLWNVTARHNAEHGVQVLGATRCDAMMGNYSFNGQIGADLQGVFFHFSMLEVSFNGRIGVRLGAEIRVEVPPVSLPIPPRIPSVPRLPSQDPDPLVLRDSNLVGNGAYAVWAHPLSVADAGDNYWGPGGPKYDLPGVTNDPNRISDNVIAGPFYYKDRGHTTRAIVPQVASTNVELM